MATAEVTTERPGSPEEAAELLRSLGEAGRAVRPLGGRTKRDWGGAGEPVAVELETGGMAQILEHNEGDLTAVLQAGVPLAEAQAAFADKGQMFAVDPPLGAGDAATIGGVVATADSGPLRHRYGGVRDLVLGITRRAVGRHAGQGRQQGDQERRGLRPRQALHRLLRDARADRVA